MSRTTPTILTNLCMVEDLENGKVVLQYRSPERYKKWSGYAFPGGHIEEGESLAESVIREVYEETGLTIADPKLVAVKDWEPEEGGRYIVFCYKATEFTGQLRSSEEGEVSWVKKDQLEKLDLSYDMLPLLEVMEDPDLSEYYYRKRTDDDWEKLRF
ncbi:MULTISPECIES: 8-oxo-dGTP diphosphatase [Streptococcus]|uniref:8-oxo-dGTP diphosphatase n=1 Tax=Streptococcus TaxID=1301 RepID=UPI000B1992AB|nr:8-oxo-dGTP diphosphatase [Streptococcus parasanguinis]MBS7077722.1 8-oxo-dGTP diphosphatase [Streptococcus parasanguinis]MCP9068242.1 8-oxo-dGTP diphosphatase [Streptococcus parasanguinis]MDU4887415.1 8-oxo-dGTP diphosphatase [Streptococcus parasanguinis]